MRTTRSARTRAAAGIGVRRPSPAPAGLQTSRKPITLTRTTESKPVVRSQPPQAKPKARSTATQEKLPLLSKSTIATANGTIIGDEVNRIQSLMRSGNGEAANQALIQVLTEAALNLVPYAEKNVRATEAQKGIYQFNSLVSMILELSNSQRALADRGALASRLVETIIRPSFHDIAKVLLEEFMRAKGNLKIALKPDEYKEAEQRLDDALKNIADRITACYHSVATSTTQFLSGG